jgi:hypothetical protein
MTTTELSNLLRGEMINSSYLLPSLRKFWLQLVTYHIRLSKSDRHEDTLQILRTENLQVYLKQDHTLKRAYRAHQHWDIPVLACLRLHLLEGIVPRTDHPTIIMGDQK